MKIKQVTLNIADRKRRVPDDRVVKDLMESMHEVGLLNPIIIQRPTASMAPDLVAGCNRLEAARRLKWESVPAFELPPRDEEGDTAGKLAMVAENLHRREISAIERAELIAEWVRLRSTPKGADNSFAQVAQNPRGGRPETSGASRAARDLGIPRDTVTRSKAIADLPAETKEAAKDLGLADNQSALLTVAKVAPDEQVAALRERKSSGHSSPRDVSRRNRAGVEALATGVGATVAIGEIARLKNEIVDLKDTIKSLQNTINGLRRTNSNKAVKGALGRVEELEHELARTQAAKGQKPTLPDMVYHDDLKRLWRLYMEEAFNKATYPNAKGFATALLGELEGQRQRENEESDRRSAIARATIKTGGLDGKVH